MTQIEPLPRVDERHAREQEEKVNEPEPTEKPVEDAENADKEAEGC